MTKKKALFRTFSGIMVLSLAFLVSCGGKSSEEKRAERALEKVFQQTTGKSAKVDLKGGKVKIQSKDGTAEITTGSAEWPEDLPSDVPKFEFGTVKGVNKETTGEIPKWMIIIQDVPEDALAEYTEKLKAGEWNIETTMSTPQGGMVQATKESLVIMVTVAKDRTASISIFNKEE